MTNTDMEKLAGRCYGQVNLVEVVLKNVWEGREPRITDRSTLRAFHNNLQDLLDEVEER